MSLNFQLVQQPRNDDEAYYNYSGSDITAKSVVIIDATNVMGTAGDGPGCALPATGGSRGYAFGVAIETIKSAGSSGVPTASAARVRTSGRAVCVAKGAITTGDIVSADATAAHAGQVSTTTTGVQFGIALSTAADGEDVLVEIQPARNA